MLIFYDSKGNVSQTIRDIYSIPTNNLGVMF